MKVAGEELIPDPELEKFTSVPPFNESQTCTAVVPEEFQLIVDVQVLPPPGIVQGFREPLIDPVAANAVDVNINPIERQTTSNDACRTLVQ